MKTIIDVKQKKITDTQYPIKLNTSELKTYTRDGCLIDIEQLEVKLIFFTNLPSIIDADTDKKRQMRLGKYPIELQMNFEIFMKEAADLAIEYMQFMESVNYRKDKITCEKTREIPLSMFA